MELRDAVSQIAQIHQQMSRDDVFRGYRSTTIAITGATGFLAATFQSNWVPDPATNVAQYLGLWLSVAIVNLVVVGVSLTYRSQFIDSGLARQHTWLAIKQFAPCVVVGGVLTLCIFYTARHVAWMLPGLWALIFSLGVFASNRLLPQQVLWIGSYYAASGIFCLIYGQGEHAHSPWLMGGSFGGGQILTAAILYWTLERNDGQ